VTRRTLTSLVLVAILCAAGAIVLVAGVRPQPRARTGATPVAAHVTTPLWSARRIPTLLARAVQSTAQARAALSLTQQLNEIVAPTHACVAVDGPGGPLARVGAGVALAPASTLKLLTATTAIERLGPDHRFTTRVVVDGAGDLVLVGGGDPLLATPEHIAYVHGQPRSRDAPVTQLAALADAIVAAGIHNVDALLVDDHIHESLRFLPSWKPIYTQEGDVGALGALTVDGGFAQPNNTVAAIDPALTTGQRLATLLAARGVAIRDGVRRADATVSGREVAHVDSPPLSAIVGEMLTTSDNYTAEELLRDVAVTAGAAPATTAAGIVMVRHVLDVLGVRTTGLVMHDGSGLAPDDRVTCDTMLQIIELTAEPEYAAIDKGLPVAAQTGTLAGRFVGGSLAGKLRAKTGSIAGVVGLVGVVDRADDLHFAFLANGNFTAAGGSDLQTRVANAIGATADLRAPPDLVPPP
jgi:D-alanyl-D-alanine carboxypeptidase/D-alanyl-D-alanine-endopeptidase (penicillin-binding protein 4)